MKDRSEYTPPVLDVAPIRNWSLALIAAILVGWVLKAMASVAIPMTFALFLAILLAPLDKRISGAVPKPLAWLGRVAVLAVLFAVLALFLSGLAYAATRIAEQLPEIAGQLENRFSLWGGGGDVLPESLPGSLEDTGGTLGSWAVDRLTALAQATAAAIGSATAALILVIFLVLLLLSERTRWRETCETLFPQSDQRAMNNVLSETASRLRRFLLTRTVIGVLTAALYVGWLSLFGLDLLVVWAILTFLLTFIPNIGSIISGILPTLFAFAMLPFGSAFALGAGLFAIEQIVGNWIDPRIQGRQIMLSPSVILIALLFWSWLWGIAGAFLATPIMVGLMVLMAHLPPMRSFALLLSDRSRFDDLDRALHE